MSRARHKKALGGAVYSGKGSNVEKEAEEKKRGGKVMPKMEGAKPKKRMDKRARGGRCGSDKSPFSSAAMPKQSSEPSGASLKN